MSTNHRLNKKIVLIITEPKIIIGAQMNYLNLHMKAWKNLISRMLGERSQMKRVHIVLCYFCKKH